MRRGYLPLPQFWVSDKCWINGSSVRDAHAENVGHTGGVWAYVPRVVGFSGSQNNTIFTHLGDAPPTKATFSLSGGLGVVLPQDMKGVCVRRGFSVRYAGDSTSVIRGKHSKVSSDDVGRVSKYPVVSIPPAPQPLTPSPRFVRYASVSKSKPSPFAL